MPHTLSHDARIYWRTDGDPRLPALVLANSLGTDFSLWDTLLPRLLRHFYVVRYDMRGHGASDAPAGEYTIDQLTDDAAAVIAAAGLQRYDFCGVSLGGMVGMNLASRKPAGLRRLVLSNTTSRFPDRGLWVTRIENVLNGGMSAIVDAGIGRFFTSDFVRVNDISCQRVRNTMLSISPQGYAGCCAAIRDMDLTPRLGEIAVPTLVVTGEFDQSTPPAMGAALASAIAGSRHVNLRSAHIPCVEIPTAYGDALIEFLAPAGIESERDRYEAGLARRKEVLGEAHVERSLRHATDFNRGYQELITRHAWGQIWTSSRFTDLQRRLIVLAITASLARWEEYELHVGAALRAGVEPEVIQELLYQVAVYAGVPAANTGFKVAGELIREHQELG